MSEWPWRDIPGFEGYYQANAMGQIRSIDRILIRSNGRPCPLKGRILTPGSTNSGYAAVVLVKCGPRFPKTVHPLIAKTFLGPRPAGAQVCHKNGLKKDNRLSNLRYDSVRRNSADKWRHGTQQIGERGGNAKLTEFQIRIIRRLRGRVSYGNTAAIFGICESNVWSIQTRKTWTHV